MEKTSGVFRQILILSLLVAGASLIGILLFVAAPIIAILFLIAASFAFLA